MTDRQLARINLVASTGGAWNTQTQESQTWLKQRLLPQIGWKKAYILSSKGQMEFQSWFYFFDNILNSAGYLGDEYRPQLYFQNGKPRVRWPLVGRVVDRKLIENLPEVFNGRKTSLVIVKPKQIQLDDMMVATMFDTNELDDLCVKDLQLADREGVPIVLDDDEVFPMDIVNKYLGRELIKVPWRIVMTQRELVSSPFCCSPEDLRKGTPVSPQTGIINFVRDRARFLGLSIPDWAQPCMIELKEWVDPSKGNLIGQIQQFEPERVKMWQRFIWKLSPFKGLSRGQWEFLSESLDFEGAEDWVNFVFEEPLPKAMDNFWSSTFQEILNLIRARGRGRLKQGMVIVECDHPQCWRRFVLKDYRFRYCEEHRGSRALHKASISRSSRRQKERLRIGSAAQRLKWAEEKRRYRQKKADSTP